MTELYYNVLSEYPQESLFNTVDRVNNAVVEMR